MAKTHSYQELRDQLDEILEELQREDLEVDRALERYQEGLKIVKQLETYLHTAENKVKALKASIGD